MENLATARGERDFEPFELIENSKTEHMNLEKKKKIGIMIHSVRI